jgi:hypothetical protein
MPRIPTYENRIAPQVVSPGQVESAAGIVGGIGRIASSQMGAAADTMAGMSDEFKAKARLAEMERDKQSNIEISSALANATLAKQDLANTLLANKGANAAKNVETWDTLSKAKDEEALSMVSLPTARIKAEEMLRRDTIARRGMIQSHQIGELDGLASMTSKSAMEDRASDTSFGEDIFSANLANGWDEANNYAKLNGISPEATRFAFQQKYKSQLIRTALSLDNPLHIDQLLSSEALKSVLNSTDREMLMKGRTAMVNAGLNDALIKTAAAFSTDKHGMVDADKGARYMQDMPEGTTLWAKNGSSFMQYAASHNAAIARKVLGDETALFDSVLNASSKTVTGHDDPITRDQTIKDQLAEYGDNPALQDAIKKELVEKAAGRERQVTLANDARLNEHLAYADKVFADPGMQRDEKVARLRDMVAVEPNPVLKAKLQDVLKGAYIAETPEQLRRNVAASTAMGEVMTVLTPQDKDLLRSLVPPEPPPGFEDRLSPENKFGLTNEDNAYMDARENYKAILAANPNVKAYKDLESNLSSQAKVQMELVLNGQVKRHPGLALAGQKVDEALKAQGFVRGTKEKIEDFQEKYQSVKGRIMGGFAVWASEQEGGLDRYVGTGADQRVLADLNYYMGMMDKPALTKTERVVDPYTLLDNPGFLRAVPWLAPLSRSDFKLSNLNVPNEIKDFALQFYLHPDEMTNYYSNPANKNELDVLKLQIKSLLERQGKGEPERGPIRMDMYPTHLQRTF